MVPFSLPSFVPSNLQHSLLSYLVRRFLGPLLKNGAQSLDDQLSTPSHPGILLIRDVQLDPRALEDHFSGSLLPFTIQAVSVSELSLKINWPPWSFSLQDYVPDVKITLHGIQITLGLSDRQPDPPAHESQLLKNINLNQNLANIANDFVREEWADSSTDDLVEQGFPGAFTTKTNVIAPSGDEDRLGFFAGLVQKILSKFNLEFKGLTILLNHDPLQVLLSIDNGQSLDISSEDDHQSSSLSREIRISCPTIYLHHPSDQVDPIPSPNSSSNHSLDSEHDMLMSQAIVDLRGPSLFVSAAEILSPTNEHLTNKTPTSFTESIFKPENILLQFTSTPTDSSQVFSDSKAADQDVKVSPPYENVSSQEQEVSFQDETPPLNPNNSLRFLFWVLNNSTLEPALESRSDQSQLDPAVPQTQETTNPSGIRRPQLSVKIHFPILTVSLRLPHHHIALTKLISTLLPLMRSTSPSPQSSSLSSAPVQMTSLTIHVTLTLHTFVGILSFPSPYPRSTCHHDAPLPTISIQLEQLKLVYANLSVYETNENHSNQTGPEFTLQLDQIHGRFINFSTQSSTRVDSTFLLVPARDDPSPAVSICRRFNTFQVIFSSILVNIDLEAIKILLPLSEAIKSFGISRTSSHCNTQETGNLSNYRAAPTSITLSNIEAMGDSRLDEDFTTTLSVPCLYIDIKAPSQRSSKPYDQRQPGSILGSVIKTLKVIITPQKQIGCSIFEAALGFRISNGNEGLIHAALSPFLGVAHSIIPSSKDHQDRYPGLRLTHNFADPESMRLDASQEYPKLTSVTLETVTIDLTKDQFDRLQYWLDDVGQWGNNLYAGFYPSDDFILSDTSEHALDPPPRSTRVSLAKQENPMSDGPPSPRSNSSTLLGSLTVSQMAVTLRLPVPDHDSKQSQTKLVLQMGHLTLHQIRPGSQDQCDSELQLRIQTCIASLHEPSNEILPILQASKRDESKSPGFPAVTVNVRTARSQSTSTQYKTISVSVEIYNTTLRLGPNCIWTAELFQFLKAPAGVFEAVGPEYATRIIFAFVGCSIQLVSPSPSPSSSINDRSPPSSMNESSSNGFIVEVLSSHTQLQVCLDPAVTSVSPRLDGSISILLAESPFHQSCLRSETISFAQIATVNDLRVSILYSWVSEQPNCQVTLHQGKLIVSCCADTVDSFEEAIARLSEISFKPHEELSVHETKPCLPNQVNHDPIVESMMLRSAMKEPPSSSRSLLIQRSEDLAEEDYPTDVAFLDANASRSRHHQHQTESNSLSIIRPLLSEGFDIIDDFLLKKKSSKASCQTIKAAVKVENLDVLIKFYDGYDWNSTRQAIKHAQKTVRKRLQKIRQLLATGNPVDTKSMEEDLTPTTLFESLHLGLDHSPHDLSTAQLLNVIDDELEKGRTELPTGDVESMTGSWESLTPHPSKDQPETRNISSSSKQPQLIRSNKPMLQVVLTRLQGSFRKFNHYQTPHGALKSQDGINQSRLCSLQLKCDSLTIIDNIRTSTWKKFLTELRPSEGGMLRPTGAPMLRFKFDVNLSATNSLLKEAFMKVKIWPLRLYVDQDAVDFLKGFFGFRKRSSSSADPTSTTKNDMFFQRVEILPIRIKLDYKPKRVNYMALKEGKTIELMNFFHFEGSDMVLRHATLTGVSRASRIGELLQEIWTPDVKANQLAEVISGISPVRSVVNLGTGIADLVLLPIEEIRKKDGRLSRGIQKGTSSFAKNTTLEVIKLGAKLAIGTQVILEKAESILGAKLNQELRVEAIDHRQHNPHQQLIPEPNDDDDDDDDDDSMMKITRSISRAVEVNSSPADLLDSNDHHDRISKYAVQPQNLKVGAQLAYHDLRENFRSTAQTILAVPLEVFNEGSGQAVVKAIPIAFLHPMVGATGAISKTLLGLQNSIDPNSSKTNRQDKYKQAS